MNQATAAPIRWGRWLLAAGTAYTLLTVAWTWPLPLHATTHLRATPVYGRVDLDLHLWTLAWVSRAVVTDPLHVFDANVFHPATHALAGSDHLLGTLPVAGPVYWITENPVATLNAVVLTSFPLVALGAFALVTATTGSPWAGLVGGIVYAFAPARVRSFVPVQMFSIQYLPLALLALGGYLRSGRVGWLVVGLTALLLQVLVAYYVAYAAAVAVGTALVVWGAAGTRVPARRWRAVGLGLVAVLGAFAVVSLPYLLRQGEGAIPVHPGAFGTAGISAWMFAGYVRPRAFVYLGWVVVALAMLGVATGLARRERRTVTLLFLGVALAGWVLCLGSHADVAGRRIPLPYAWLAAVVPGFASMRLAFRFFLLVTLGVGGLAGLGFARIRGVLVGRPRALATAALLVGMLWELRPVGWPLALEAVASGTAVPPVYRWLARHGDGGALLEAPIGSGRGYGALRAESRAMYFSTVHWLPLLNGYTAYPPPSYGPIMEAARALPQPGSVARLRALVDVEWVLVRRGAMGPRARATWAAPSGLEEVARFGDDVVYRVTDVQGFSPTTRRDPAISARRGVRSSRRPRRSTVATSGLGVSG